jgi:hypothetical protein
MVAYSPLCIEKVTGSDDCLSLVIEISAAIRRMDHGWLHNLSVSKYVERKSGQFFVSPSWSILSLGASEMVPIENGFDTAVNGAISERILSTSPGVARMYSSCQYPARFAFTTSAHRNWWQSVQGTGSSDQDIH